MDAYEKVRIKSLEFARIEREIPVRNATHKARIQKYMDLFHSSDTDNYCVAFIYWCYQQASAFYGMPNVLPKDANAVGFMNKCHNKMFTLFPGVAHQPGDIFVRYHRRPHAGMVNAPLVSRSVLWTIEGNTYVDPATKARGVFNRKRDKEADKYAIFRPTML